MSPQPPRFCDVSLPVPLDQPFTYLLPETLRHRVRPGCRLLVPFGPRTLTGFALRVHDDAPPAAAREALRLIDEEPALDEDLLRLGRWIAGYYCAPLGEVLRTMTPLGGEIRRSKTYSLTDAGRDAARQLLLDAQENDPQLALLRLLEERPFTAATLARRVPDSAAAIRSLLRRGFLEVEEEAAGRDPLRAPASRLQAEFARRPPENEKLRKAERELLAFLELHPGSHNLAELDGQVANASTAARALARRRYVTLTPLLYAASAPAHEPHELNLWQQRAYDAIAEAARARRFQVFLIEGVTGSGKTEVYLRAIDATLAAGRGALLLVPEIALTPAMSAQFSHRFGDRVAILHSAFGDAERAAQWRRIRSGAARVVVGTRSSVFAPVRDPGLIIVDEEHDHSYKQGETPRYHGRDVAIVRARDAGAVVVLGSATPSLESRFNAARGKYTLLDLPERIERRPMPTVEIVDMRVEFLETRKQSTFSRRLLDAIKEKLDAREQAMLLLNRRGYSSFAACRACGWRAECVNCAVTLTYHHRDRRMLCHYCNHAERVPRACPKCESEHIYFVGTGSEKVEDELHRAFPEARIVRMDRDTVTGKRRFETILQGFRAHEYDILVGTQMIAKGHDIPNVTLVGVVSADTGLGLPDFRAAERTFQLLTQVAGRAGRGQLPGTVLLQTINPEHYAVRYASMQDYPGFYAKEIEFRRLMRYPPYAALANVMVRGAQQEDAMRMAGEIGAFIGPPQPDLRILGPAEAHIPRLKNEYRYQMLLKAATRKRLNAVLQALRTFAQDQRWPATALVIDVDPLSLL